MEGLLKYDRFIQSDALPKMNQFDGSDGETIDMGFHILSQQLESMNPIVAKEAGNTPEDAERLDRTGSLNLTHIGGLPAELVKDSGYSLLCLIVVAAYEHCRLAAFELWIHHACVADRIESLNEASTFKFAL